MNSLSVEIKPARDETEFSSIEHICQLTRISSISLSERIKGLIAVSPEGIIVGGVLYYVGFQHNGQIIAAIDALAVHPAHQKKKIGKNIVLTLIEILKIQGTGEVTTVPINHTEPFYESCGFQPDNEHPPIYMLEF
ncbi:GNAT family N-acetyltransferase [Candidatus Woesearchaeota archaeon]|nr:GNAT family N-acetyltransferase [Candidatus Woesearchaeota archaeon]